MCSRTTCWIWSGCSKPWNQPIPGPREPNFGGPDFRRTLYDDGNTHSNTVRLHRAADGDDEPGLDRNRLRRQYQGGYADRWFIGRLLYLERRVQGSEK